MYQPAHQRFLVDDPAAYLAKLAAAVPATLVTLSQDGLVASILPMVFHPSEGPNGTLRGHLARGNPQWRDIAGEIEALAIFDGPDSYITPGFYETKRTTGKDVPTWNYTTVHARGPLVLHHDLEWLLPHLRALSDRQEASRPDPWSVDDPPEGYIETQARAIVGIEMRISTIDAKRKLSQNRNAADFAGVLEGLSVGSPREQDVATEMRLVDREPRTP
jgi:transcriptional regulator